MRLEEQGGRRTGEHAMVPWYYWEAATIYRKLKRYDEEVALIRRFARNYDINFRVFSKRYRLKSALTMLGPQNFLNALARQEPRRPLVLKTTIVNRRTPFGRRQG